MTKRLIVIGAAVAALFVAAVPAAAGRFVITSTSQIKPSVIRALRGNQTARGLPGCDRRARSNRRARCHRGARASGCARSSGTPGEAGAAGTARAVALVNADGTLVQGIAIPNNVTGVSHTTKRGIYCIGLASGIDPAAAIVSLTPGAATGVFTVPNSANCASGEVEVDTFILVQGDTATPGTPLVTVLQDGGFTLIVP